MSTADAGVPRKFFGKYRGTVVNNLDPLFQGRIMADVPAIPGLLLNFAMPCVPYAGPNVGFYAMPPIGANVWIEFEGGDPNYPIWAGCFWGPEDVLHVPEPPSPEVKIFKTDFITMVLSDLPVAGGFSLTCSSPAVDVPLSITFDSSGITLLCPQSSLKITPESIGLAVPDGVLTMRPEVISIVVAEAAIDVSATAISVAVAASSIDLTAGALEIDSPAVGVNGVPIANAHTTGKRERI